MQTTTAPKKSFDITYKPVGQFEETRFEKIHNVDTSDAKEAAYEISYYGRLLAESQRELDLLESLDERLSRYKYKKEVKSLDDDTLGYYRLFLEVLDAS